jgi:hypothetical protein
MRFCIVGTGRCGSTLLRDLLNTHPEVFVFAESHWIPKMYEFFGTGPGPVEELLNIVLRTTHVGGELVVPCDEASLRARFRAGGELSVAAFCDSLGSMFAEAGGKRYWADKTPDYGGYMAIIQTLWPSCRFIHAIRDGVEVTLSMSRHPGYQWLAAAAEASWVPPSFNGYHRAVPMRDVPLGAFADLWERRLRRIRNEAGRLRAGSFLEVRFEHLLARPRETLREICAFTGLAAAADWEAGAALQVDPARVASRRARHALQAMGAGPRALLAELGYASDEGAA